MIKVFCFFFSKKKYFPSFPILFVALTLGAAAVVADDLPSADEFSLLAAHAPDTLLYRFAADPAVVVVLFPSLHEQALTLNRVAVFLEYAGASRTHVLDDASLHKTIAEGHMQFDYFYDGHDYRATDLARFFTTADTDGVALNPSEKHLRADIARLRGTRLGFGALISLPQVGADALDAPTRAAILRHELSHGLYFTDPVYAAMVARFWQTTMTDQERVSFRHFLGNGRYDTTNDDLVRNEMQAYLIHTPDPRFFSPAAAGLSDTEVASLRAAFVAAMPAGWLRNRTTP
jgi:hypothetical protein